jgi:hypothetical protein
MLRAPWWGVLAGTCVLAFSSVGAEESATTAVRRLQQAQTALAATPDPDLLLTRWPGLAADLMTVLRPPGGGRLSAAQVAALADQPTVAWPALQGVWLPLFGGAAPTPADAALLRELGVLAPERGPAHPLAFFAALEGLSPQADGGVRLTASLAAGRATVQPMARNLFPDTAWPDDTAVAARLRGAIWWNDLSRVRQWPLVTGSFYRVVARADLPWPPAQQPLAVAFAEIAASEPAQYAAKWQAHGILLGQLERMLRREEAANHAALLAWMEAYYRFLCHAVVPATPFRPRAAGSDGRVFHFSDVWEEDQPQQSLFCRASHLGQVQALQSLLGAATRTGFDPGRHIFMVPFDAAGGGGRWQVRSRRFAYLGYLDAFAARDYPFILRPYTPERPAP